ncbi:MAG: hypothetical protein ACI9IP_003143 [Arcticibacterium sp.]|jgi:hypothetical protein
MKKNMLLLILSFLIVSCSPYQKFADREAKWEEEITRLEYKDDAEKYSSDAVLFIGSSSIRIWQNIKEDMAPYEPIRRGYGGAHFSDLIHFTKRLVYPHEFQALCIFVANDITGGDDDRSVREVMTLFKEVVNTVRIKYPVIPIFQIAITPTGSRWSVWSETQKVNAAMKAYCDKTDNLYFIDSTAPYLNEAGMPRDELFIKDRLHQNQEGYDIWAVEIKKELDKVLK